VKLSLGIGAAFALVVLAACSSTNFCAQKVTINFAAAQDDGGCQLALVNLDGGLNLTVIVPPNQTACEEALKSCSSSDVTNLNNRVTCANDAGSNPPACIAGHEVLWSGEMDMALGSCITANPVSTGCEVALLDAG